MEILENDEEINLLVFLFLSAKQNYRIAIILDVVVKHAQ